MWCGSTMFITRVMYSVSAQQIDVVLLESCWLFILFAGWNVLAAIVRLVCRIDIRHSYLFGRNCYRGLDLWCQRFRTRYWIYDWPSRWMVLDCVLEIHHANDSVRECISVHLFAVNLFLRDWQTHFQFIFITTICFNTEITYNGMEYPRWLIAIGWGSCLSSCICIPIYIIYKLSRMNGSIRKVNHLCISIRIQPILNVYSLFKRIRIAITPNNWGPAEVADRKEWDEMIRNSSKFGTR